MRHMRILCSCLSAVAGSLNSFTNSLWWCRQPQVPCCWGSATFTHFRHFRSLLSAWKRWPDWAVNFQFADFLPYITQISYVGRGNSTHSHIYSSYFSHKNFQPFEILPISRKFLPLWSPRISLKPWWSEIFSPPPRYIQSDEIFPLLKGTISYFQVKLYPFLI